MNSKIPNEPVQRLHGHARKVYKRGFFYDKVVIFFSFFVSEHLYVYLIVCWCLRCWMNSSNSCSVSLFYSFFRWKRLLHGDLQVSKVCS